MDPPTSPSYLQGINFHHEPTTPTTPTTKNTKLPNTSPTRSDFSNQLFRYPKSPPRTHNRSATPLRKSRNVAKIIKGEIHNVLTVMRSDPRYYTTGSGEGKKDGRSRFEYEERRQMSRFWSSRGSSSNASSYRGMMRRLNDGTNADWSTGGSSFAAHPILQGLRDLYDVLSTMESDFNGDDAEGKFPLNAVAFVSPFAAAVRSPDVDAKTTGAALSALHKFIVYGFIGGHNDWQSYADAIVGPPSSSDVIQESIAVVARCIRRCSFDETISNCSTGGRFWSSEKRQKSSLSILNCPLQHSEDDGDTQTTHGLPQFLLQPRRVSAPKGSGTPKAATIASEDENVVLKLLSLSVQVIRCPAGRKYLSPHDIIGIFDTCLFVFLASGDAKRSLLRSAAADALSHFVIVVFGMGAGRKNDSNNLRPRDDDTGDPTTVDGSDSDDDWGERDPAADMDEDSFLIKRDASSKSQVENERPKPDDVRETHKPIEAGDKDDEPALVAIMARLAAIADPLVQEDDTCVLSLSLINIALETMNDVDALASKYPRLLTIMQNDLCRNLLRVSTSSDLTLLGLSLRVIFNLFGSIKHHLKLQLEVFLTSVHLRMLSSSTSPTSHQQVWSSSPEHRELALESLLEFCREPMLMMDLYLNYDCDINCTNLFETIMITLAKVANPEEGQVDACDIGRDASKIEGENGALDTSQKLRLNILNRLALEGIIAVIDSIARRCRMSAKNGFDMIPFSIVESEPNSNDDNASGPSPPDSGNSAILGNTLCIERNLLNDSIEYDFCSLSSSSDMVTPGKKKVGYTNVRTNSDMSEVDFELLSRDGHRSSLALRERKIRKRRLAKATVAFNESKRDKEWIAELERIGAISSPATPESVALFLHSTSKLDKVKIGEYISKGPKEKYPFIEKVLEEFTQLFDFSGMSYSESLRLFLSTFRLPGEAQCIDRLMEAFAKHLFEGQVKPHLDDNAQKTMLDPPRVGSTESASNSRSGLIDPPTSDEPVAVLLPFKSADSAFILAFSTIMLNTDLHNPNMAKRMTLEEFIRNNRGINDGDDLPKDFLEELYYEIRNNEIQVKTDTHDAGDFDGLLERANEIAAPFFTSSQSVYSKLIMAGVHERDMYMAIASATTRAISTVFVQSWDDALVMKALNGLSSSANICAYFGLKRELNEIIQLLLSWGQDYIDSVVSLIHSDRRMMAEEKLSAELNEDARLEIADLESDMIASDLPPLPGGFVSALNSEKPPDQICSLEANGAAGSAAHRGLLSLNCALLLSKHHLSAVNEALPTLLEVMFALRDVDALPPRLSDLDDFADSRGNELELSAFAKDSSARVNEFKESLSTTRSSPSNSGSFLSMFSFGRGEGGRDSNSTTKMLMTTHPLIKVLKVVSKKASLDQIILKTNDVNMAKRILSSMLSAMFPDDEELELELLADPLFEHNAVFVLELAARLLISNRTHSAELLPIFLTKFEVLFSPKKDDEGDASILGLKYPYLLERIIVTILRAVIHLYDVPDRGLRAHLVRLMELISRLPFSYTKEISDRLGCGAAIILRGCFFLFESPEEWCAIRNLLDIAAKHPRGRPFVFDGIASLVDYTLPVDLDGDNAEPYNDIELSADGAEAMKSLLLKFLEGSYDDDLSYKVASMMLMRRVYSRLQSNSQKAPSDSVESIDSSQTSSQEQGSEWIKMVTLIYNDVCLSNDMKTAEKGFQSLQEVLLSTKTEAIPADQWLTLMQMACTNPPSITLQASRISSLSLIGRLFLTLMPELSNHNDNWEQLEDFTVEVAKIIGENLRSGRSTPLFETTVHTVTNICNVISMSGFNNGQGINFCAWVGDTLLSELEKVGACGGIDATVVLAAHSKSY